MATSLSDLELAPRTTDVDDVPVDKLLVLKFQTGGREAYAEIFERYRSLTERICFRILGNREDAQEAVQETMIRVLRGLETFNGRYQLQAWIARIATNVSVDMLRARARRPNTDVGLHIGDQDVTDIAFDPEELVEKILEREAVLATLEALPSHHRDALVLREFEGRSHEEIGDALGVSPAQAKALIHRAKGTFRKAWTNGDRRGLAAIVPILLAPFRLPGLRRLVEPARDAVASASATATQVAVNVTAAPAAAQTAMSAADRVTAVALTVIVAGSATVGAVAIRQATKPASKPSPAFAAAPAPSIAPEVVVVPPTTKPAPDHKVKQNAEPEPVAEPSSTPSTTPSSDPSAGPSPGGSPIPPPPPPPAPAWAGSFATTVGLSAAHLTEVSQQITPQGDDQVLFMETAQGALVGPKGKVIGDVYLDFGGVAGPTSGSLSSLWLFIDTPEGRYTYAADASLVSVINAPDGSSVYVFSGGYALNGLPETLKTLVPHDGQIEIRLSFWQDGALYATGVAMSEA